MPIYSLKEFSKMTGLDTKHLSTYKSRRKLIYSGRTIDTNIEINQAFLIKYQVKVEMEAEENLYEPEDELADSKITEMMEKLNEANPKRLIDKIKNEVDFVFLGQFLDLYSWTAEEIAEGKPAKTAQICIDELNEGIEEVFRENIS